MEANWLTWAKRLQAISQIGLTYVQNDFDKERYQAIGEIALEILAEGAQADIQKLRDLFIPETGYVTPKVDIRGVVFQNDLILLVKDRGNGLWTLPGGWADVCETPAEGVVREIAEESGFKTRVLKLLAVYDRDKHIQRPSSLYHIYKLFFHCELIGGEAKTSIETSEVGFFPEHAIPPLSTGRVTLWQIQRMFEHVRHPEWPTDYD